MIDALVVPLIAPKPDAKDKPTEDKAREDEPQEEPKPNGRRRKKAEPAPEANGQPSEATPPAAEIFTFRSRLPSPQKRGVFP